MIEIDYVLDKKIKVSDNTLKYFGSFLYDKPTCPENIILLFNLIKDKVNPVFFDIGACTGSFTLMPILKEDIKMIAFEPTRTFVELEENINLNNIDALIYNVAVSDYDGVGEMNELADDLPIALSMLGGTPASHKTNISKTQVSVVKIDTFCGLNNLIPDVIKIDVEGNELFVLKGAEETINKHHPIIFCEYSEENTNQYKYTRTDIYDFLIGHGYTVEIMDNDLLAVWEK